MDTNNVNMQRTAAERKPSNPLDVHKDETEKKIMPKTYADLNADTSTKADAAEEEDVTEITVDEQPEDDDNIIELSKSYKFEGKVIKSIDIARIEDLSGRDAKKIDKLYKKIAKGNISVQPELTNEYAIAAAHYITQFPVAFFEQLSIKDIIKIRNRVINFTFGD